MKYCSTNTKKCWIIVCPNFHLWWADFDENCAYWIFPIHILNSRKDEFAEYMKSNSITVSPVHFRNDQYDCNIQFKENNLTGVDFFTRTQICIPNGWWLSSDEIDYIVEKVGV